MSSSMPCGDPPNYWSFKNGAAVTWHDSPQTYTGNNGGYPRNWPYSDGNAPPVKLTWANPTHLGQMGIDESASAERPRCDYCGRKQEVTGEYLCAGCGNVL